MPNEKTGMQSGQQMRYTDNELNLIQATFKNNEELLKLLRKAFLPELDPEAPIGQTIDLWMTIPLDGLTPEQAIINLKARNSLISHVDQRLMELKVLAESDNLTPEQAVERLRKNSNR